MAMREGDVLGAYRIVRLVGRGGMGAVYLADDLRLGRHVALKVLGSDTADIPTVRERFVRESRLAASLDHPNILPIYEAGEADGQLFIAMRYVPGQDLERAISSEGPLAVDRTVALIDQVASALDAAHAAGLIHRDVKPGNILLAPGSQPGRDHAYLSDFGLTKHGEQTAGALTRSGQLIGSVGYVAPEQIENLPIDARVDVYSLGCVVYECLSGAQPFPRDTEMATLYAHVNAPLPSLALARPELPPTIDAVIAKAMAKSPDDRYATAGELAKALSDAVRPDDAARHLTRGFLFSDLRDYTAFIERNGDAAAAQLLETYRRLVRDVVRRFGGAEIKTEGDSFYVVFPSASDAVRCGVAIVDAAAVASANTPERPIHVGIGVHAGETAETDEGYVGSAVNIAARVCAQAAAGEVLVTDTVRGLTRTSGDIAFTSRGKKHLKGIEEPMAVYAASATVAVVAPSQPGRPGGGTPIGRRLGRDRGRDRRRPAIVVAVVALAVVGLVGAGFLLSRGQSPAVLAGASPSAPGSPVAASVVARTSERIVWSVQDMTGSTGSPCVIDPFAAPITDARLWMMDPDGTDQVPLLPTSDVFQGQPAWRPDGKAVVFVGVEQDFTQPLWTVAADGTATERLQPSTDSYTAASSDPAWSRDGKRIALIDAGAIVTIAPDGSGRVEVRQQTKPDGPPGQPPPPVDVYQAPTWMPDGRIAFVRRDGATDATPEGPGALYAVAADGTGYEQLLGLELNTLAVDSAAWSPDGQRIALAAQKGAADSQIWLVNSDGTGLRQLTTEGASKAPTWSPDGSSIAFTSSRDGHFEIYRMAADGSAQERLTDTASTVANCRPTWADVDASMKTPAPSTSPAPGASAGLAEYHRGRLDAGHYRESTFAPGFTMDLPSGWDGRRNYIDAMAMGRPDMPRSELDVGKIQTVSPDGCARADFVAIGQTPLDLVTWLQHHKLLKTSNLQAVNLAGYSGLKIDVQVRKSPTCPDRPQQHVDLFGIGQDSFGMGTTDQLTFVVLDVKGTPVTIIYGGPPEEGFKAAAQPIVDSIKFSP